MALNLKATTETEEPQAPPPLRPLSADCYRVNRGDEQHRHFFALPSREYFEALRTSECDRLLINVRREVHELDRAEFRIAGQTVIEALFLKPGGNTLKIVVINETDISAVPIELPTGTGQFRSWYSGDHRRYCLLSPRGEIIQTSFTNKSNADHAASVHNNASPISTMAGR